jgi:hypothetical protein
MHVIRDVESTKTVRRFAVIAVAAVCLVIPVGSSPAALAATPPDITAANVHLSTSAVAVSGLAGLQVTISATLTSTSLASSMSFEISTTSGIARSFLLVAGAVGPVSSGGTWSGTFWVTSSDAGTWTLTGVGDADPYSMRSISPVQGAPVLTVTGTHVPRLTVTTVPNPVPVRASGFTVTGTATDSSTGLPVAGALVGFGVDTGCLNNISDRPAYLARVHTSSTGTFSFAAPASAIEQLISCVSLEGSTPFLDSDGVEHRILEVNPLVRVLSWISVVVASSSEPVGRPDAVTGSVGGLAQNPACLVELWQLHGSTQWRSVGQASVRASGRYTLSAVPTVRGRNYYKVYKAACGTGGRYVAASTTERVIVGT